MASVTALGEAEAASPPEPVPPNAEMIPPAEMVDFVIDLASPGKNRPQPQQDEGKEDFDSKLNEPTGSAKEAELLESRIKQLETLISGPRINTKKMMSEAVWDPNYGLAKVTNAVGKWSVFGHNIFGHNNVYVGGRCLFPEEMVFMMEKNKLEATTMAGVPLSLSKAWDIMLKSGVSLEQYNVFSELSRLGYKVSRHKMAQKLPLVVSTNSTAQCTPLASPNNKSVQSTSQTRQAEDCDIPELRAKIKDQGDKVRSLKTSKAPKSQISLEVATLLAFKAQYKATTGQEWEPETASAAKDTGSAVVEKNTSSSKDRSANPNSPRMSEPKDLLGKNKSSKPVIWTACATILNDLVSNLLLHNSTDTKDLNNTQESESLSLHVDSEDRFSQDDGPEVEEGELVDSRGADTVSSQADEGEEDDDIVELSAGEVAWQKCLDLIPNCFGKANITVESPPLDLLPFRSWPKKSSYTININKIGSSSRKRNNLCNQSSDIGVEDDEIEIIEQSSLNDSRGGHAEERQHSVSQTVSTTEYDSSRYGHSNGSFETDVSVLPQGDGDSEIPRKKSRLDNRNNNGAVLEKDLEAKNVSDEEIIILDEDEATEAPSHQNKGGAGNQKMSVSVSSEVGESSRRRRSGPRDDEELVILSEHITDLPQFGSQGSRCEKKGQSSGKACWHCSSPNHYEKDCPHISPKKVSHLSTSQQRRVSADGYYGGAGSSGDPTGLVGGRDPKCWNCSQTGHVQRYCPYLVGAVDVNGETIRGEYDADESAVSLDLIAINPPTLPPTPYHHSLENRHGGRGKRSREVSPRHHTSHPSGLTTSGGNATQLGRKRSRETTFRPDLKQISRSLFEDNFIRGSDGEGSSQRNLATDGSNSAKRHWKKRKQVENCRQRRRQRKKDEKTAKSAPVTSALVDERFQQPLPAPVPSGDADREIVVVDPDEEDEWNVSSSWGACSTPLKTGPASRLWSGKVVPLVAPSDFKTTTGLLTKLMMPGCCDDIIDLDSSTASSKATASETDQPPLGNNSKKGNTTQEDVEDPATPKISYDVFMPSKFTSKKGSAAASKVPDYRVVVCSPIGVEGHSAVLPSFDEIAQVTSNCRDKVPVLFAISKLGSISFYCFSAVGLPALISMG